MAWVTVPGADEMKDGRVSVFEHGDNRLAICRQEGAYYAIDDVCTHDGGPLDQGYLDGCQIECPRHGARFDITTGRATALPAVRGVRTYPTRVAGGKVEVEL